MVQVQVARFQQGYCYVGVLNRDERWTDVIFLHVDDDQLKFFLKKTHEFSRLLPAIAREIEKNRLSKSLRSAVSGLVSLYDTCSMGVAFVDERGQLLRCNSEAQRILDLRDGFFVNSRGRLQTSKPNENIDFMQRLQRMSGAPNEYPPDNDNKITITRENACRDLLLALFRVPDHFVDSFFLDGNNTFDTCVMLAIIDPAKPRFLSAAGISAIGSLTNAEKEVADLLIAGKKVSEICDDRSVSENTVRCQIRSISDKLNCNSQRDIILLAAATQFPSDF